MLGKTTTRVICILTCTALLTPIPTPAADGPAASNDAYHYYYFKERKPLVLDTARVAVFSSDTANHGGIAAIGEVDPDLDVTSVAPIVIRGWSFISTTPEARTAQRVEESVRRVAAASTVDFISPIFFGTDGGPVVITPQILVGFHLHVNRARAEAILAESNAGVIVDRDWGNMRRAYRLRSNQADGFAVLEAANALARRPEVRFAEPDVIFTGRGDFIPNDTFFGLVWGIHNTGQDGGTPDMDMDGPEAWDITLGDPAIKVLIIDVGVEQTHPDINQLPGADTTSDGPGNGGPVNACDNHGTAVAGCVSAIINNSLGTVGIAPNCKSVSVRPFISNVPCDGTWNSVDSWTVDALTFGESIGVRVTNNSNHYGFESSAIEAKYEQTRADYGMVHFASADNSNLPTSTYPASLSSVNSVAALERHGARASFSNYGSDLFISAPGQDVLTTDRTGDDGWVSGDYVFANGTSFASPYTAGVAALVLSLNPNRPAWVIENILASTAVNLGVPGWDSNYGWGFVNARAAVLAAADTCDNPGPPDCNFNGVLDSCDIYEGTIADCNANGIPDDCESAADCQPNGFADICDIFDGTSRDCNGNGISDECEPSPDPDCNSNGVFDSCDKQSVGSLTGTLPAVLGFVDISGTGTALNFEDDGRATVVMPFVSAAFDTPRVRVSNNGGIGFGAALNLANPNLQLPNLDAFEGNEALLPFWDDFDGTTGNVYYATVGSMPTRTFIVEWKNRPEFPGDAVLNGDEGTFQLQIFESPVGGVVAQYLYADTNFLNANFNDGRSATVGYQRSTTSALQWSFNTAGAVNPSVVISLLENDLNSNGRPDDCDPTPPLAAGPPNRNRSLGLSTAAATSGPGATRALRVTMVDLQNPVPLNLPLFPPPQFGCWEAGVACGTVIPAAPPVAACTGTGESVPPNAQTQGGCARWVGKPGTFLEDQEVPLGASYRAARLQCTPHYQDWTTAGLFYITGAEIVPSSKYDIHGFAVSCAGMEATCIDFSPPLRLTTARSGDVEAPFNPPSTLTQPDAIDVAQVVAKVKNLPGALVKSIAQLQPNLPELNANVNALDIVAVVNAVKQFAYAFEGPCPCPSLMTCGSLAPPAGTPCATDAVCTALPALSGGGPGAKCVKTCVGGTNAGDPCINSVRHCPGGTCGNGFCRDRCGRCTPP